MWLHPLLLIFFLFSIQRAEACRPGQFRCDNGDCIDNSQRCDRRSDCTRGEDELNCPDRPDRKRCGKNELTCGDGTCIPIQNKCDGHSDCPDNYDEKYCPCKNGQFQCALGHCIPIIHRCDGTQNCQDGSDEFNCPNKTTSGNCKEYQRECNDGTCVDQLYFCNGKFECPDKSDESNCCLNDEFRCSNGTCLLITQVCDRVVDCQFGEDEEICGLKCDNNSFKCNNNEKCIPKMKLCDNFPDCNDHSDEINCSGNRHNNTAPAKFLQGTCPENEFQCSAGYCIMGYKRCNGYKDCPSGNDEENCPIITDQTCGPNQFHCNNGQCIEAHFRCDHVSDCADQSDEINCESDCSPGLHRCNDGSCVNATICDRIFDCSDGSDEADCNHCAPHQFKCNSGGCVDESYRCDNIQQCADGSDEENCVHHCPQDQFRCGNGVCLDGRRVCDGYNDCPDQSDEKNCTSSCQSPNLQCGDMCIEERFICDQFKDCPNGEDEENCKTPDVECGRDEFECEPNVCIPEYLKCNGRDDCENGLDELDCKKPPKICSRDEFTCNDGSCIPRYFICDGTPQCRDYSDEADCGTCADPDWFQCEDGACVASTLRCDNFYDCRDFSDEQNCFIGGCQSNEFHCGDGQCIPENKMCDRTRDCRDGSDERNCPTEAPKPEPEIPYCPYGQQPCRNGRGCYAYNAHCDGKMDCNDMSDEDNCPGNKACDHGQFRCENGPCIPEDLRCDGKVDCPLDSSDELDCPEYSHGYNPFNGSSSGHDGLNLRTYPNQQEIKESREVVFQCRDEGPIRARVQWSRANGYPMPVGTRDVNGRLEMPNIQLNHSGSYICSAVGYPLSTPGAQVAVHLEVNPYVAPTARPPQACGLYEATCANGDCIAKHLVCDGNFDCSDGSDETRCNAHGCEPNEYRCSNKRCVLKTWRCDGDDDCGDGSDEHNCATNVPGSPCLATQFACRSGHQCIPKSFHCDQSNDCTDGSDEIGCSPVTFVKLPPPMVHLEIGQTFEITCTAVGIPTPEITWRLNWGHIPEKCHTTSVNGVGTLTCPDIQIQDQGAYSCEGINIKGVLFAVPDTILVVGPPTGVCLKGFFNEEARSPNECIPCFCFGVTKECNSADLFTYHLQPPIDSRRVLGVRTDHSGVVDIRDEPIYRGAEPRITPLPHGRNGVHALLEAPRGDLNQPDVIPYFVMPENYHGNQLKSYGGYLKYNLRYEGYGTPTSAPDVILSGNGYTLLHTGNPHQSGNTEQISVRFFVGDWIKKSLTAPETVATREEIMMTLAAVDNILIKLQYINGHLDTTIDSIEMDSAAIKNTGLGQATFVEECRCPVGYTGLSCESCASGYSRHRSGPWLGQCYKEIETCPPGYYGDPSRGIACQVCPCPLTNPGNQFAKTCHLDSDGDVTCDCPPEYVGRRCESCAHGYTGNPLNPGDYCKPAISNCNADGTLTTAENGVCHCKANADGPTCASCKKNAFYLHADNQFGCISCFCMGVSDQCFSSYWYRDQVVSMFTSSKNEFKLVELNNKHTNIEDGITLDQNAREIVYRGFNRPDVYYWSLPSRFLGDKVTAYGGYLRYSLRYVPSPGGQSSKNNAPDVELISAYNHITLNHFIKDKDKPLPNTIQTFQVPLFEQYWQRSDGQKVDREHLMMALADISSILIKATYTTNTREAALQSVSLDIADERNTGNERAFAVEQCHCPPGYKGLSCEDCDAGYTRTTDGIYLGRCEKCQCNGHSNECDPENGTCFNCRDYTMGENCETCIPGYEGSPADRIPCRHIGIPSQTCECHPDGSISNDCVRGVCQCKTNVQGNRCDRCREGTFGLNGSIAEGCQSCFCSGVVTECHESNLYIEQIPSQIYDPDNHGFTLTDQNHNVIVSSNFELNAAMNEIGYVFRPSITERLFWSLPGAFTGSKIKSYGGKLEYTQRYTQRLDARYSMDQDIIIIGNGITIYWTNPIEQRPNIANRVSVTLSPSSKWQRLDFRQGPRPASREDILKVLANINAILIRAQLSTDTARSFISDLTLDTAVDQNTGQSRATNVEVCVCPQGYSGTSCESCAPGYYRDINDLEKGPLGSCSKCPCNDNEVSCLLGPDNRVICNCLPGFAGHSCESSGSTESPIQPHPGPSPGPPTITVSISSPQLTIKDIGGEVRFICTARSVANNNVRVRWSKDEGALPERAIDDRRGLLVITNLVISDSGKYVCEAFDGISIVKENVVLVVGGNDPNIPQVEIHPRYLEVNEGEPIDLQCVATGNPSPQLEWVKVNREYLNPSHTFTGGYFRIQNSMKSDEGEYECIARNSAGIGRATTIVYVKDVPVNFIRPTINPSYHTGTSGESFTLTCEAGGPLRSIYWSKQHGQLPYNSRDESGILIVTDARVEDSGTYICTVTNYAGLQGNATATVNIISGDKGVYPSVKVEPTNQKVSQGSNVEIRCEVSGSPTPTVKWTKIGDPLPSNVHVTGPVLNLYNVQMKDRGVYVCVANNNLGLAQASTVLEIERREAPVIEIHPQSVQTITTGGGAIMQCRINSGIPEPSLRWHRPNGEPLSSRIEQLSNGVLRFSRITLQESGEYICTAENEVGKVTAIGNIVVQTPPVVMINPSRETLTVQAGEFVRLECRASGSPQPSIQWSVYKPDSRAIQSQMPLGKEDMSVAVYEITSVGQEDEGIYTCMGRNNAGANEGRIRLVVTTFPTRGDITGEDAGADNEYPSYPGRFKDHEKSHPNVIDEQTFSVPVGTRIDLRCNFQNSGNEQIYANWIRTDNSSLPQYSEIREGNLIISNVQPSDAGEYNCLGISTNDNSILFIVKAHVQVISPPRITIHPSRQVVRPGDNAVVECTATGEEPITISWSGLNRSMPTTVYTHGGYLQFHAIKIADAGHYRCTAINAVGEADSVAEILVEENIQQPPIIPKDQHQTAVPGSTVTLTCTLRPNDNNVRVHWYRENNHLPQTSRNYGNQLLLVDIQPYDAGRYYCQVPNEDGELVQQYIDVDVNTVPNNCGKQQWQCNNLRCIDFHRRCDKRYDCYDFSDEFYCARNRRGSRPTLKSKPSLEIQASSSSPKVNENLQLYCRSTEPGVITLWTKLSGRIADNVQVAGNNLKINGIRMENAGIYRCEARGYEGVYHEDYHVDVADDNREEDIPIKYAPQGSSVILDCKTDLDGPVNYLWSKKKGIFPRDVDTSARSIQLNDVSSSDAGIYTCVSSNAYKTIEAPKMLVITGIVPYFTQAPSSFIGLPPLQDSDRHFSIEISFKPQVHDGLILYNGNKKNAKDGDFISLALVNGIPEFKFNLGHNSTATKITGDRPLTINQWHTIKINRNKRKGTMYVDGGEPLSAIAMSKYTGLTLSEPLYLGGVPNFKDISPLVGVESGMVGCISLLKIGHGVTDILKEAQLKKGITSCETCSENPCQNKGVCQESLSKAGFMCICQNGYSGPTCNRIGGESCTAHTCATGRCVDTDNTYKCMCPLGRTGHKCEREIEIKEPAFNKHAYMAYPTPTQLRRLKISIKIKPKDLSDGVIAYCAENEEGDGEFVSLAIKDRLLEFRFDVGNGPVVIRSDKELVPEQWVAITANRLFNEGRLIINGHTPIIGKSTGNHKSLNLNTEFYIGGVDHEKIKLNRGVGVESGFRGCVSELSISSVDLHLIHSVKDAANVQECSTLENDDNNLDNNIYEPIDYAHEERRYISRQTGCDHNPCRNDGTCSPSSPTEYKCFCINGYTGKDCEIAPNQCDQLQPCQNQGTCHGNTTKYECDCRLGFTGINCETPALIRNDVNFNGKGYLEFDRNLLDHSDDENDEVIALELSTNSSDGLIFWQGQTPDIDGHDQDYIALALVNGFLEFSYDLGSGPAFIYNNKVTVNDNLRHRVILKRKGRKGSIEVDNDYEENGESVGIVNQMNTDGNIYLGGTPNISLMTGQRFTKGFEGCIHGFELQDSRTLDLGAKAISGVNVKACYRHSWIPSSLIFTDSDQFDEIIPPPPVNIIHPKPSSSESNPRYAINLCFLLIYVFVTHSV